MQQHIASAPQRRQLLREEGNVVLVPPVHVLVVLQLHPAAQHVLHAHQRVVVEADQRYVHFYLVVVVLVKMSVSFAGVLVVEASIL